MCCKNGGKVTKKNAIVQGLDINFDDNIDNIALESISSSAQGDR